MNSEESDKLKEIRQIQTNHANSKNSDEFTEIIIIQRDHMNSEQSDDFAEINVFCLARAEQGAVRTDRLWRAQTM